ncbi:MAG: tetratricopeptide repeat protein [Armatimonadetes bacterium]|nr:tetratricopeptide repeat protein [Armatimonadota bacterium]
MSLLRAGKRGRGLRIWLYAIGLLSLAIIAVAIFFAFAWSEAIAHAVRMDPASAFPCVVLASGLIALLALANLLLATAAGLRSASEARGEKSEGVPASSADAVGRSSVPQTATFREWLFGMGVLCLLPPLVLAIHAALTRTVVDPLFTYFLVAVGLALVILACLCFAFASMLRRCATFALRRESTRRETAAGLAGDDTTGGSATNPKHLRIEEWLRAMGSLCLLATPIAAYCLLMSNRLYGAFPRWHLVAFALAAGMVFGLLALSSLAFAAIRVRHLTQAALGAAPVRAPGQGRGLWAIALRATGLLCLLAAVPVLLFTMHVLDICYPWGWWEAGLITITWGVTLVTMAALSFGVANVRSRLSLLTPSGDAEQPSEDPLPADGDAPAPEAPAAYEQVVSDQRHSGGVPWRRSALIAGGLILVLVITLAGSAVALGRQGLTLGVFLSLDDRHEDAVIAYTFSTFFLPHDAQAQQNLLYSLFVLGRHQEALAATDRALALAPDDAVLHYNRGVSLLRLGRYEEALAAFDKALALDPGRAWAYYGRASAYAQLGNEEAARKDYTTALELAPSIASDVSADAPSPASAAPP